MCSITPFEVVAEITVVLLVAIPTSDGPPEPSVSKEKTRSPAWMFARSTARPIPIWP